MKISCNVQTLLGMEKYHSSNDTMSGQDMWYKVLIVLVGNIITGALSNHIRDYDGDPFRK